MISVAALLLLPSLLAGGMSRPLPDSAISADSLRKHVEFLAGLPKPRHYANPAELRMAYTYIEERFRSMGLATSLQKFQVAGHYYVNVVAVLHPDKPKVRVLGAHYDVCGEQPGADDNASGVAGLLEAARFLKAHEEDIDEQIQFVAYANEEPPFFRTEWMGSHIHAKSLKDQGVELEVAVVLECIGYFSDAEKSQSYPSALLKPFYPSKGNFIAVVGNFGSFRWLGKVASAMRGGAGLPVRSLAAPTALTGVDFSDHRSYWAFDYAALMITNTAFFRNANYHEAGDVPGTLDYARMREVVRGAAAFFLRG